MLYHRSSRNNGSGATPRNPPSGCEDERRASNKPRVNGKTAKGSRPVNAGAITLRDKPNVSEEAREKPGKRGLGRKHGGFLPGLRHSIPKKHNLCTEPPQSAQAIFLRSGTDDYGWLRMITECGTQTAEQIPVALLMPSVATSTHGCEHRKGASAQGWTGAYCQAQAQDRRAKSLLRARKEDRA